MGNFMKTNPKLKTRRCCIFCHDFISAGQKYDRARIIHQYEDDSSFAYKRDYFAHKTCGPVAGSEPNTMMEDFFIALREGSLSRKFPPIPKKIGARQNKRTPVPGKSSRRVDRTESRESSN